jgi:hypothetical protein
MRQSPTRSLHNPARSSGIPTSGDEPKWRRFVPTKLSALNCCRNSCVELIQLRVGFPTYFDSVGHCTWRGCHSLNSPAKSSRRASRNSATSCRFCAVNQSCSSSRLSTDESTDTGISTVSLDMQPAYQFRLEKQTLLVRVLPASQRRKLNYLSRRARRSRLPIHHAPITIHLRSTDGRVVRRRRINYRLPQLLGRVPSTSTLPETRSRPSAM